MASLKIFWKYRVHCSTLAHRKSNECMHSTQYANNEGKLNTLSVETCIDRTTFTRNYYININLREELFVFFYANNCDFYWQPILSGTLNQFRGDRKKTPFTFEFNSAGLKSKNMFNRLKCLQPIHAQRIILIYSHHIQTFSNNSQPFYLYLPLRFVHL